MSGDQPFVDRGGKPGSKTKCPWCGESFTDMERHLSRNPFCLRKSTEHDQWCPYRKRIGLSFALGELSQAIRMEDGVYHHTDGSVCDSRRIVDFVPLHKQVILVCGHNLLVFKEPSR